MNAEQVKLWSQIVARAWADDKFKQRRLADPGAVLKENGVAVPGGWTVKVVENTDTVCNLVLPGKPKGELTDAELQSVAGGGSWIDPVAEPRVPRAPR